MNLHSDTATDTKKEGCSTSCLLAHDDPDYDSYSVEDWKEYIHLCLEHAVIKECERVLAEEIAVLPPGKMRNRMLEAFEITPCFIANGGAKILARLASEPNR